MRKILIGMAGVLLMCSLTGCSKEEAPKLLEPVGVKMDTTVVQKDSIRETSVYQGQVVPYVEELCFEKGGELQAFTVCVGDLVEEGQVLARLSDEQVQEEILSLEEEIAHIIKSGEFSDRLMEADIQIAKEQLVILKNTSTVEQCKVQEVVIEQLQAKLRQARELRQMQLDRKNRLLEECRQDVEDRKLKAPFSGRVVYVKDILPGQEIKDRVPVICIADDARMTITTDYISKGELQYAERIYARIGGEELDVVHVPYDNDTYVSMVLSGEKMSSQFVFAQEFPEVASGQFAVIMLEKSAREDVLTVPSNALYKDADGRYVYQIVEGQKVRADVTVGIETDVKAEIVEGLAEGDEIYVSEEIKVNEDADYTTVTVEMGEYRNLRQGEVKYYYPVAEELAWTGVEAHCTEIKVAAGDRVKKGDILMVFDLEANEVELEELTLKKKRTQESAWEEITKRQKAIEKEEEHRKLRISQGVTKEELRILTLQLEQTKISYEQFLYELEKELNALQRQIEKLQEQTGTPYLAAPFDGVIEGIAPLNIGDRMPTGVPVIRMYSEDAFYLMVENGISDLRYNMEVTVSTGRDDRLMTYHGTIVSSPDILPSTISSEVAVIKLTDASVKAGNFVGYTIFQCCPKCLANVLIADKDAIKTEDGKSYAYILENGLIKKRYLTVGMRNTTTVWILDGLSEGQTLIVD